MHAAISEVITRCDREQRFALGEIDALATSMSTTREQFFEAVLLAVAELFQRGELAFDVADAVANEFWRLSDFSLSGRAREVFLAFDEGEYYHSRDPVGSDPVQLYTRPQLAAILRGESGHDDNAA